MGQWERKALEKLLIVQDIDIKIRVETDRLEELNLRSVREDPVLNNMKTELASIDESLGATFAQQEMYRNTLDEIRNAIKGLASTKSGAFKPRTRSSTEALRIEEEKLGVLVDETEDQISKLKAQREAVEKELSARSKDMRTCQQVPEAEIKKHRGRIKKLEEQREAALKGIPVALLRKYERLKQSRSGVGLTIMVDGVCRVCRMQMPTGVRFRLLKGEPIATCPACGRMVAKVENPMLAAEPRTKAPAVEDVEPAEDSADEPTVASREAKKKGKAKRTAPVSKDTRKPVAKKPVAKKPAAKKPVAKKPVAEKPVAEKRPSSRPPKKALARTSSPAPKKKKKK